MSHFLTQAIRQSVCFQPAAQTSGFIFLRKQGKNEHKLQRDWGVCLSEQWVEHPKGLGVCSVGERWHQNIEMDQLSQCRSRLAGSERRLLLIMWGFLPWKSKNGSKQTSYPHRRTNSQYVSEHIFLTVFIYFCLALLIFVLWNFHWIPLIICARVLWETTGLDLEVFDRETKWQNSFNRSVLTCDSEKQSSSEFLNPSGASIRNCRPSASSSSLLTDKHWREDMNIGKFLLFLSFQHLFKFLHNSVFIFEVFDLQINHRSAHIGVI